MRKRLRGSWLKQAERPNWKDAAEAQAEAMAGGGEGGMPLIWEVVWLSIGYGGDAIGGDMTEPSRDVVLLWTRI